METDSKDQSSLLPANQLAAGLSQWQDVFSVLFDKNPTPMCLVDPKVGKVLDANAAAERLFGWTRAELAELPIRDICADNLSTHLMLGRPVDGLLGRYWKKDGQLLHMRASVQPLLLQGKARCLLSLVDVSAQKIAEAAYTEVQRKYQTIFLNAVEGFYINTPEGRFVEVNPAFARMLGYESPEQLIAEIKDVATHLYVNPAQRTVLQELLKRKGFVRSVEFQAKRRDGQVIWLSVSARAVNDATGKLICYEGLAEDVTERKLGEAKLRQMNETLASNMRQLEGSNADLQQFAYAVSHDLKEPLRLISSYLTLLSIGHQESLSKEGKEFLAVAVAGAKRMKGLVEDLLTYSTIGANDFAREELDVRDVVEDVLKVLQPLVSESGAVISVGQLPVARAMRSALHEVFIQLVGNAIKFRREDVPCQISIGAFRKGDSWVFQVQDNGIGIDVRHMNRVFQIFQRAHNKQRYSGNGIGLAICKKIVEMHDGRIWLDSTLSEGSTFYFTLPVLTR